MAVVPKTYPGAGRAPTASSIVEGELALNTGDGCLYTKLRDGRVVKVVARTYSGYEEPAATTSTASSSSSVSSHASTHHTGGSDALTAANIGAAAASHASNHHTGGSDALTPANIGAPARTTITHIVKLTQAEYNALSSTPATTLYIIT